jgi:hypothetical protein
VVGSVTDIILDFGSNKFSQWGGFVTLTKYCDIDESNIDQRADMYRPGHLDFSGIAAAAGESYARSKPFLKSKKWWDLRPKDVSEITSLLLGGNFVITLPVTAV